MGEQVAQAEEGEVQVLATLPLQLVVQVALALRVALGVRAYKGEEVKRS